MPSDAAVFGSVVRAATGAGERLKRGAGVSTLRRVTPAITHAAAIARNAHPPMPVAPLCTVQCKPPFSEAGSSKAEAEDQHGPARRFRHARRRCLRRYLRSLFGSLG